MANEINIQAALRLVNGPLNANQTIQDTADQTTAGALQNKQTIATGGSTISFSGLTAARWVCIQNTDAANYVDIGPDSGGSLVGMIRLKAGECCILPLKPSTTIKAIANTSAVVIALLALET